MTQISRQIIFTGRVQGVGFRFTVYNLARRNFLTGFVRNLPDGSVELIVQGDSTDITDCVRDIELNMSGQIQAIDSVDIDINPNHTDFKITY